MMAVCKGHHTNSTVKRLHKKGSSVLQYPHLWADRTQSNIDNYAVAHSRITPF